MTQLASTLSTSSLNGTLYTRMKIRNDTIHCLLWLCGEQPGRIKLRRLKQEGFKVMVSLIYVF